jgi:HlyD family secretion protein
MNRKYLLPILAIFGALVAIVVVFWSQRKLPPPPIPYAPAESPYVNSIAGAGIIEASSLNITIGSPFSEIVTHVYVTEGDMVKAGDPLFVLDLRTFNAQKAAAEAELKATEVVFLDKQTQFSFYERLSDSRAVSEQNYQTAFYAMSEAEANVKVAKAKVEEINSYIQRSIIRARVDGQILQVNIRPGEIAPAVPFVQSESVLIVMGIVDPLQVRVDIDENDAWRFKKGAPATAFVRGNSAISFPLEFVRVEPYIIPKSSFTGDTTERVDTRVLQVLYRFKKKDLPVYIGQLLDIYIDAQPKNSALKKFK